MKNFRVGALCLTIWFLLPRASWAEEFLYLPITRTPVITAGFCGYRTASGACHGGIDYDVRDDGDGIFAAAEGVVEAVSDGWSNTRRDNIVSYGNSVRVRHPNGYLTIYGHLKRGTLEVGVGDEVRAGELLGIGDNSGWSTGSHLHFEVRDSGGRKVDPYGDSPFYPNCGDNSLWVVCPPVSPNVDEDADTWTVTEGDCDDTNPDIHPGAGERCNGLDDNCANGVDEEPTASASCSDRVLCTLDMCMVDVHSCTSRAIHDACEDGDPCTTNLCLLLVGCRTIPKDTDLDGYTDVSCGGDDCDDFVSTVHPGALEICNGIDDDCDRSIDESCIPETVFTYCCDGRGTIRGPAETWCVQLPGAFPSELWADWDDTTCAVNGAGIRIGESCDGYGICSFQNFYGVCGWHCTSHASLCLNDRYHAYCTKQCGTDRDCPPPLTCQATDVTSSLGPPTVYLCREVY